MAFQKTGLDALLTPENSVVLLIDHPLAGVVMEHGSGIATAWELHLLTQNAAAQG